MVVPCKVMLVLSTVTDILLLLVSVEPSIDRRS